jgi:hypothetical protein
MVADKEMIFVYSEMQINEDTVVNRKLGRNFKCGSVYVGSTEKQFSKIIDPDDLEAMIVNYPDTKIIYRGRLSKTKYDDVTKDFIKDVK